VMATVHDGGSGPATPTVSAVVTTASVGTFSVPLTALDNAGNSTTVSCAFRVGFSFTGFSSPVNNPPESNSAKAGQSIPLKWRIADYFGVGIDDPSSFVDVSSSTTGCSTLGSPDAIEAYAGGSGLQSLGNGNWQFSWKTPTAYAGQCRVVRIDLADGSSTHEAKFQFK
jgi:hypothetical protein